MDEFSPSSCVCVCVYTIAGNHARARVSFEPSQWAEDNFRGASSRDKDVFCRFVESQLGRAGNGVDVITQYYGSSCPTGV